MRSVMSLPHSARPLHLPRLSYRPPSTGTGPASMPQMSEATQPPDPFYTFLHVLTSPRWRGTRRSFLFICCDLKRSRSFDPLMSAGVLSLHSPLDPLRVTVLE